MKFEIKDTTFQPEDTVVFWLEIDENSNADIDLMAAPKDDPGDSFVVLSIHQDGTLTRWNLSSCTISKHFKLNDEDHIKFSGETESENE